MGQVGTFKPTSYPTSDLYTINISDLISNINPEDGDLLKYIPDGFLNDAQKQSKDKALKQEDRKLKSIKSKTAKEVESKPKKKSTKKKVAEAKEKILSEYEDILTDDDVDTFDEMFADKDYRKTLKEHKADERHTIEQEYFADLELNEDANTGKVWAGMSKIIDSVVSESNAEQEATGKPQTRENDEGKETVRQPKKTAKKGKGTQALYEDEGNEPDTTLSELLASDEVSDLMEGMNPVYEVSGNEFNKNDSNG